MPSKPKTIKPEKWWMEWHPHYGFMGNVGMTREDMRYGMDLGSTPVRVEIRDAATAKLRDAVIAKAINLSMRKPGSQDELDAAVGALEEAKAVRHG
jgi:D-mannonate dehydratase